MRNLMALSFLLAACGTSDAPSGEEPLTPPEQAEPVPASAPAPAAASGTESVELFGGRTGSATRFHQPPQDSVEYAILESLKILAEGDYDRWMDTYCHADACDDERKRESMASHVLPSAQAAHEYCVHNGDLLVTRSENENGYQKTWIYCGSTRMPAPSTAQQTDDGWRFSSISW